MAQLGLVGCDCAQESEHVSLSVMCCHIRPNLCGDDGEVEGENWAMKWLVVTSEGWALAMRMYERLIVTPEGGHWHLNV